MAKNIDLNVLTEMQGGPFHLVSLVEKRLRELVRGARPLVDVPRGRRDLLDIVLRELIEGRIEPSEEATPTPAEQLFTPVDDDDDDSSSE